MDIVEEHIYDPLEEVGTVRIRYWSKSHHIDDIYLESRPKTIKDMLLLNKLKNNYSDVSKIIVSYFRKPTKEELKHFEVLALQNPRTFGLK